MSMNFIILRRTIENKKAATEAAFLIIIILYWTYSDNELVGARLPNSLLNHLTLNANF